MTAPIPDLHAALKAVAALGDPWRVLIDYCTGCTGTGWLLAGGSGLGLGGLHRITCWDCNGTGKGDPTDDKDIAHDD